MRLLSDSTSALAVVPGGASSRSAARSLDDVLPAGMGLDVCCACAKCRATAAADGMAGDATGTAAGAPTVPASVPGGRSPRTRPLLNIADLLGCTRITMPFTSCAPPCTRRQGTLEIDEACLIL